MRRVIACMVVMVVLAPTLAQSQTSVSQVLHINTSDVARYLELRPRPRSSPIGRLEASKSQWLPDALHRLWKRRPVG